MRDTKKTDLQQVRGQFAAWRKTRRHEREAIPDELWRLAARLCESHPMGRVRSVLGLEAQKLKSKVGEFNVVRSSPQFINVELPNAGAPDPVFEWVRPDGARLRVRVQQSQLKQVVAEFFGGGEAGALPVGSRP